jgi:hypothetical protein
MVYGTLNYWVFGLRPLSGILKNTTFRKLDLFPSSVEGWETPTQLSPLERANPNIQASPPHKCGHGGERSYVKYKMSQQWL